MGAPRNSPISRRKASRRSPGLSRAARLIIILAACCFAGFTVWIYASLSYDGRRAVMWWLHRHVFVPTRWSIGQSGWDRMMTALEYLQYVATPFAVLIVAVTLKRLTAASWLSFRKHPLHCCQQCGYDLTGNTSGVCSECGVPIADAEVSASQRAAMLEGLLVGAVLVLLGMGAFLVCFMNVHARGD